MKRIINRRKIQVFAAILAVTAASAIFGHGCSGIGQSSKSNSGANSLGADVPSDFVPIPNQRTVSTVYAKQILDNNVSCTGIGSESTQTRSVWTERRGSLSEYGYATHITAPKLMAIASVAGEVCNDLIRAERARGSQDRNIFTSFDLSATPGRLPASSDISDAASRLALACWQRNVREDEIRIIESNVMEAMSGAMVNARQVENAALLLCTGMLSSLSAIEI